MKDRAYCETCRGFKAFEVVDTTDTFNFKGTLVQYPAKEAHCCDCGSEVWERDLHDANLISLNKAIEALQSNKSI